MKTETKRGKRMVCTLAHKRINIVFLLIVYIHICIDAYTCIHGIFNFSNRFAANTHAGDLHETNRRTRNLFREKHVHRTYTHTVYTYAYIIHTYEHVDVIHTKHAYIRGHHTSRIEANRKHREWSRIDITYIAYTRVNSQNAATYVRVYAKLGFGVLSFEYGRLRDRVTEPRY